MKLSPRQSKLLAYVPCAVLLGMALNHFILVRVADLNPWLGAGFGMFSTTDGGASREFRVFAGFEEGEEELSIPEELDDLEQRTRALPSQGRLRRLAREMARIPEARGAAWLRLDLWRTAYDKESMQPTQSLLRTYRYEAARESR